MLGSISSNGIVWLQSGDSAEGTWSGNLAVVHSYIQHKATKEEEQRRLQKQQQDMQAERVQLENKAKQIQQAISVSLFIINLGGICKD